MLYSEEKNVFLMALQAGKAKKRKAVLLPLLAEKDRQESENMGEEEFNISLYQKLTPRAASPLLG